MPEDKDSLDKRFELLEVDDKGKPQTLKDLVAAETQERVRQEKFQRERGEREEADRRRAQLESDLKSGNIVIGVDCGVDGECYTVETNLPLRPTYDKKLYKLVETNGIICRTHLVECRSLLFNKKPLKARILRPEGIKARQRRQFTHEPAPNCTMCETIYFDGNRCYNDDCKTPLHPQWPGVYCSMSCCQAGEV